MNKRIWIAVSFSVVVGLTALTLVLPLVRAVERNVFALALIPLVQGMDWTNPQRICSTLPPPPTLTSVACHGDSNCYLGTIQALRMGKWDMVPTVVGTGSDPLLVLARGWSAWCGGSHESAVVEWQRAAKPLVKKFLRTGEVAFLAGDLATALQAGLFANAIGPSTQTHMLLGRVYEKQGDITSALTEFRAALEFSDFDDELYWRTSDLEWQNKETSAARTHLERAIELKQDNWLYWHRYGQILIDAGEAAAAESAFARAVELNPTYGFAHAGVMLARLAQGHVVEAREPLLAAVKYLDSDSHKASYLGDYASRLMKLGDPASAQEFYRQALDYAPEREGLWYDLANAYAKAGDCERSARAYTEYSNIAAAKGKSPTPRPTCRTIP